MVCTSVVVHAGTPGQKYACMYFHAHCSMNCVVVFVKCMEFVEVYFASQVWLGFNANIIAIEQDVCVSDHFPV